MLPTEMYEQELRNKGFTDEQLETMREVGEIIRDRLTPHTIVQNGTPHTTEKQRRRYRLMLGIALYVLGLVTGFQWGMER